MANNINPYYDFADLPTPDTQSKPAKMGTLGKIGNFISDTPGFIIAGVLQLAGGILGGLFAPEPKATKTPEQMAFERMTKHYRDVGERFATYRGVISGVTGKPPSDINIGYKNFNDMWEGEGGTRDFFSSIGTSSSAKEEE